MKEADDIARKYWEVRDEAKALEEHAKAVAGEAAAEARDAQKKRVTVCVGGGEGGGGARSGWLCGVVDMKNEDVV